MIVFSLNRSNLIDRIEEPNTFFFFFDRKRSCRSKTITGDRLKMRDETKMYIYIYFSYNIFLSLK